MKIIIIGAGPVGMAAAIAAAQNPDNDVTVLEKNDIPGKKLLISGSGRCNVTNGIQIEEFFLDTEDATGLSNPRYSRLRIGI